MRRAAPWLAAAVLLMAACRTSAAPGPREATADVAEARGGVKASSSGSVPELFEAPCVTGALEALEATCYTFRGQERWDAPDGGTVTLPVAVIEPEPPADMGENRPTPEDSIAAVQREPAVLGFEPPWLCAWWGSDGDVPPEHNDPVASTIPALAIHGQLDPCCGTRWSERLAESMPALQIVELQGVGYSPETECRSRLIREFLADPREPVDRSCRDEVPLRWELPEPDGPG